MSKEIDGKNLFEAISNSNENYFIFYNDLFTGESKWCDYAIDYFNIPDGYEKHTLDMWISKIHPDDVKAYLEDINQVFSGKSDIHCVEYRARNKYGEYVWLECSGKIHYDENGKRRIFAGVISRLDTENRYDTVTHLKTIHCLTNDEIINRTGTCMIVGINDFRSLLNSYGYEQTNVLLEQFAQRLSNYCRYNNPREKKLLFRFIGDEFILVFYNKHKYEVVEFFNDIANLATHMITSLGFTIDLSVTGGAVEFPVDGDTIDLLIKNLEHSLQYAKINNKGGLTLFSEGIKNKHIREAKLAKEITSSIKNDFNGFELYYQPLINPANNKLCAVEALLRYKSQELGQVPIPEAITHLENSGEINIIGKWVFEQACIAAKRWHDTGHILMVGINVSYMQYEKPDFVDFVIDTANRIGVDKRLMCLELTESTKISNIDNLSRSFKRLRDEGFCISLDDFGTEYANLDLLRQLDVDSIKIDQSFVRFIESTNDKEKLIVENILDLCKKLNINVIVEGVETAEIRDMFDKEKITFYQGYLYDKPLPYDELVTRFDKVYDDK